MSTIKNIFIGNRLYGFGIALVILAIFGFIWPGLYSLASILLAVCGGLIIVDLVMLFGSRATVNAKRYTAEMYSLGAENTVSILIDHSFVLPTKIKIIDEAPIQFQQRHLYFELTPQSGITSTITYQLRPMERGDYAFGNIILYISTVFGLINRRVEFKQNDIVKVYPSIKGMKETEFLVMSKSQLPSGLKKIRRVGHHFEFEEIKEYRPGDDVRKVNWKATARRGNLMVNVMQEQKSQPVYCVINKGRTMYMPFDGLTLQDHAINSALAVCNILLKKSDKAGLITFEKHVHTLLKADARRFQLKQILEHLYNEKTTFAEPNYYALYATLKQELKQRSLLLMYTNFESLSSLEHQLPIFQKLNQAHLLVIIFFENTELTKMLRHRPTSLSDIYQHAIGEKFDLEKRAIKKLLTKHGIQSILTSPDNLTMNVVNKYLEIKQRGLF